MIKLMNTRSIPRVLVAGIVALAANMLLLGLADHFGIVTARGGFQRLVKLWTTPWLVAGGLDVIWSRSQLPDPGSAPFMVAFKIAAGLTMALVYLSIEPALPGRWWAKGLFYALLVWLLNAAVVLPLLGQGFAGARSLTWVGMIAFALAHTTFFLVLAWLYRPRRGEADVT
jgi:hypothetical protein